MEKIAKTFYVLVVAALLTSSSCFARHQQRPIESEACNMNMASPFANVTKWVVTITGVSTIYKRITAAEAKRVNAKKDGDLWAEYDRNEKCYILHGYEDVEVSKKTITNPKYVQRLNALMSNPDFSDYRNEVTIRGNVAYARWYGGNRGGGVGEDFPEDIANLFEY